MFGVGPRGSSPWSCADVALPRRPGGGGHWASGPGVPTTGLELHCGRELCEESE